MGVIPLVCASGGTVGALSPERTTLSDGTTNPSASRPWTVKVHPLSGDRTDPLYHPLWVINGTALERREAPGTGRRTPNETSSDG